MADISPFLQKIRSAIYGEDVRGSIYDALSAMNVESNKAMEYASTAKDSAQKSAASAQGSASVATQKAKEALDSAGEARTSEVNAKASENNSIKQASDATKAAAAAANSEQNAKNSENLAIQKAKEASDSQTASAQSEAEAKAAEQRTKDIKAEAETLETNISADRRAVETAREATEAARDKAIQSQNAAKASEDAALLAKTAAESAKDESEEAKNAAENFKTFAERAAEAAEDNADDAAQAAADAASSALSAQQYSGKPPKPQDGTWWIWDATQQKYLDSGISCDLVGPTGNGVDSITLTSGDHTPGTTDIYTVTMTDGTSYNISVYNGRNGTGAGDVLGIDFDLILPAAGWLNGEITIADNRLLALNTHKYFVSADEACRDEYIECGVTPKDVTTTGFITFQADTDPTIDLTINVIRFELSANGS